MPAFAIGLYNIRDASWRPAYREVVDKLVAKHGGRYVARTTNPWEVLEGAAPDVTNITMIEFPSMERARAWYNDPEYAPMKRLRQAGSHLSFLLVEGSNSPKVERAVVVRRTLRPRRGHEGKVNDTDARLWHPWLRINRVLRVMLHTRWSAEAWAQVRVEFKKALALRSEIPARGVVHLPRPIRAAPHSDARG